MKVKYYSAVVLMAILTFMNFETRYHKALGDYVLEALHISPWSNGDSGFHYTILYFGVALLVVYFLFNIHIRSKMEDKPKWGAATLIVVLTTCVISANSFAMMIKANKNSVESIALWNNTKSMEYSYSSDGVVDFNAMLELRNFSSQAQEFTISFINPFDETPSTIDVLDKDSNPVMFRLQPKETRQMEITSEDYIIKDINPGAPGGVSSSGFIVKLTDRSGRAAFLKKDNFFGASIAK